MFFKKKEEKEVRNALMAGVEGKLIPMESVSDPVFAQKMMGDGYAVISSGNVIHACADATISMIFPSNHAVGLTMEDGMEILIHIGIDTVNEEGKGFTLHTEKDAVVKGGDPLITIDREYLTKKGYDLSVMMIFTNSQAYKTFAISFGKDMKATQEAGYYIPTNCK